MGEDKDFLIVLRLCSNVDECYRCRWEVMNSTWVLPFKCAPAEAIVYTFIFFKEIDTCLKMVLSTCSFIISELVSYSASFVFYSYPYKFIRSSTMWILINVNFLEVLITGQKMANSKHYVIHQVWTKILIPYKGKILSLIHKDIIICNFDRIFCFLIFLWYMESYCAIVL